MRARAVHLFGRSCVHHGPGILPHVLQAHAAGLGVHRAVLELGGDPAAAGDGVQAEPLPVLRQSHCRVSAQQGAHGQAVLRRGQVPGRGRPEDAAAAGRTQARRPEEPEEAPAADVRPGPGPGRGGNDVGRPGTPGCRPEPVQHDRGRRRRPTHRFPGVRPGRPTATTVRRHARRAHRRVRSPSHAVRVSVLRVIGVTSAARVHPSVCAHVCPVKPRRSSCSGLRYPDVFIYRFFDIARALFSSYIQ